MSSDLDIWDNAAEAWSNKVTHSGSLRSVLVNQTIDELLSAPEGLKILDAGCGDGVLSNLLAQQHASVTAVDFSSEMVKNARQKFPDLNFSQVDLLKPLPYSNAEFDVVFANMVLMHLSEINLFFKEAHRILKRSGFFIFSVLHPAFNTPTMRLYKTFTDRLAGHAPYGLAFDYFKKNQNRRAENTINQNLTHYHRTLEEYSQALSETGFVINRILEPHKLSAEFLEQNPKLEYATRLPRFLFIKAQPI